MEIMTYSGLRKNLSSAIEKVNEDSIPIFVTKQNGTKAVLMGIDDYKSTQETMYLMSNPVNAEILIKSIQEAEQGLLEAHELIENE